MSTIDEIFEKFDFMFNDDKKSKQKSKGKQTKDKQKTSKSKKRILKKDKVYAVDENGNEVEAYWDDEAAKQFHENRIKRIIKSLHS